MTTADEEVDTTEARFIGEVSALALCALNRLSLNAVEADLIYGWRQAGIPLFIVRRVMQEITESAKRRNIKIRTLNYFAEEIEAQFGEWLELQVGK